ncbi:disease resistance protein RPV1-like [Bidens hawaiensis]|uniref:disease resistance protein RPV1-like n=1 Tax=Bidens hawaiensis TaxID=980011 RepID=UPI004048F415
MVVLTELLPGSTYKYEVFLSFRGADTRYGFTDHLYDTLLNSGIVTFLDDEEIETGEQLKPELEGAIRSSRASVIVLSENYVSSTWCLDELALILEQRRNFKQLVIPIFYNVEPTDVRKQQNSFGEAMAKHKQRMETETNAEKINMWAQKIELWKGALTEVAGLKGMDAKNKKETKLIEEVATNIYSGLGAPLSNTLPPLIGMDYEIRLISSWLTDGSSHTANILTLVGIGGIGKTFLAEYVFRLHSRRFLKSSFIKDINRGSEENFNGLLDFQKKLHRDVAKKTPPRNDVSVYTSMIETALKTQKVFIVLDDIGSVEQLDALLGNKMLHEKSKIIITTRDASLSERCALFDQAVQPNHQEVSLNGLSEFKSLELLCVNAFKSNSPKEGFRKVSEKLVKYCEGHPLALQVLCKSLHN